MIIKADRALFAQMLIIAENRKLKMRRLQRRMNNSQREDLRPRVPRVEGVPSERGVNRFTTGLGPVSRKARIFSGDIVLFIFKTRVSRVTKLCSYFNFYSLYNM